MISFVGYLRASVLTTRKTWNDYWFSPSPTFGLGVTRVALGLWIAAFAASWFGSLVGVIGGSGIMDVELTRYLIGYSVDGTGSSGRLSLLYWNDSPRFVDGYLATTILLALLMIVGVGGRWTVALVWFLVLGVVHRVPMLQGRGELLAVGMLGYLVIDSGKVSKLFRVGLHDTEDRSSCRVALRLIQVHFLLWMVASFLSQVAEPMWWNGSALWSLAAAGRTTWWSRDYLVDHPFIVNAISNAYSILFALMLVLLVARGCRAWGVFVGLLFSGLSFGMSGDVLYSLAMLAGLSAFVNEVACELQCEEKPSVEQPEASTKQESGSKRRRLHRPVSPFAPRK